MNESYKLISIEKWNKLQKYIKNLESPFFFTIPNPNDPIYIRQIVKEEIAQKLREIIGLPIDETKKRT